MKKILLCAVLLISSLFYLTQMGFAESAFFSTDGNVLSGKALQENLYDSSEEETVKTIGVKANDIIYSRGSSYYVGEGKKKPLNVTFPMIIKDGQAIQMLDASGELITSDFTELDSYEGLILNNGAGFNDDFQRADWNEYILVRLSNGLYINSGQMEVQTFVNDIRVPSNSVCYFTPDFIRYYYYDEGNFKNVAIEDVDYLSKIKIGSMDVSYYDFLLNLGEIEIKQEKTLADARPNVLVGIEDNIQNTHNKTSSRTNEGKQQQPTDEKEDEQVEKLPIEYEYKEPKLPETPAAIAKPDPVQSGSSGSGGSSGSAPAPPATNPNLDIKYPNWEMPSVKVGEVTPGIYSLKTSAALYDPAGVVVGGLTYEIVKNGEGDNGKLYKRSASQIMGNNRMNDINIPGLEPEYNYKVKGYFKYKDIYGRICKQEVVFLEETAFRTKPLAALGSIQFEPMDLSNVQFYPDKIMLPNIKFTSDSDGDAVACLSKVVVVLDGGEDCIRTTVLSSKDLETLKTLHSLTYSSSKNLLPDREFNITIKCYDRFTNELPVANNQIVSRTCKTLPKADITLDTSKDTVVGVTATLNNSEGLAYENLRIQVADAKGEKMIFEGVDYCSIRDGEKVTVSNLKMSKTYTVTVLCDCDVNDGKDVRTQRLGSKTFSTSPLEKLGPLYVIGTNKTAEYTDEDGAVDPADRAVLEFKINRDSTNSELLPFVDSLSVSLVGESGSFFYTLTDAELNRILTGEAITLDTDRMSENGLKSNSSYAVRVKAQSVSDEETSDIRTISTLTTISTEKQAVKIEMKNVQGYAGFITADIRITDPDEIVVGEKVILQIHKPKDSGTVVIGAFSIAKNTDDFYQLRMFADTSKSIDGIAYDIEGGVDHTFRFIAEEANVKGGLRSNYTIYETVVSTGIGVTGKVYLKSLDAISGDNTKYDAHVLVEITDSTEWLANKTCYVKITQKVGSIETLVGIKELTYSAIGAGSKVGTQPLEFNFDAKKSNTERDKYYLELYVRPSDTIELNISSANFSTTEQIFTISTYQELLGIKSSECKYVVINDITHTQTGNSATGSYALFGTKNYFKAQLDFQGFTLELNHRHTFIYQMERQGKITNLVFKNNVRANNNSDVGMLVYRNYGTLSNIYVEYTEEEYTHAEDLGWNHRIEIKNGESVEVYDSYPKYNGAFVSFNYGGTIENFVVDLKTPMTSALNASALVRYNTGNVRNGYVFSSDGENNIAEINLYKNVDSGTSVSKTGMIGENAAGGTVENVFSLLKINAINPQKGNGCIVGYNNGGKTRNSYSLGDVLYNGETDQNEGPSIGQNVSSGSSENVYYISKCSYSNTFNTYCSFLALRNAKWQNGVLNKNSRNIKGYNVEHMIEVGCYPQVYYSSNVMPAQPHIALPFLEEKKSIDLVFSEIYVPNAENPFNDDLAPACEGNQAWDTPVNGKTSQSQVIVMQFSDPSARDIYSIDISDVTSEILAVYKDGSGITTAYVKVVNAKKCLSKYKVNSVIFKNYAGAPSKISPLSDRYVDLSYYWTIKNPSGSVDSWDKIKSKPSENFILMENLDFGGKDISAARVASTFSGQLDGNGKELSNIGYTNNIYGTYRKTNLGLFSRIEGGEVRNLTLRDMKSQGVLTSGILTAVSVNANIENVYVVKGYVSGGVYVGGLVGIAQNTSLINCGVTDVKVLHTGGYSDAYAVGGLVGYAKAGTRINRCYAQNIYLESMLISCHEGVGGLVGLLEGSGVVIAGGFATGVIQATADGAGGIIGVCASNTFLGMTDVYADVDIIAYNGSAGGLVGKARAAFPEGENISFGNVSSGIILEDDDPRRNTIDAVSYDTVAGSGAKKVKGLYYEGAIVSMDGTGQNHSSGAYFSYGDYVNNGLSAYINSSYFSTGEKAAEGILPKLVDDEGNILPNQKDEYISENTGGQGTISISNMDTVKKADGKYTISFTVSHAPDVKVEEVFTDYRYVDKFAGLDENQGVKCFTKQKAIDATISYARSRESTNITIEAIPKTSCDIYRLTALRYTKGEEEGLLKVNRVIGIEQQFKTIGSLQDWKNKIYGSYGENFEITEDIDFDGETLTFSDEQGVNNLIMRLRGTKGEAENYTDIADDGSSPYHTIKNVKLEPGGNVNFRTEFGYFYEYNVGFIRQITAECSKLTFEDISIKRSTNMVGVIAGLSGDMTSVEFKNCNVEAANRAGLIGFVNGDVSNVYVCDSNVKTTSSYAGGLSGLFATGRPNSGISELVMDRVNVSSGYSYAGGVMGFGYCGIMDMNNGIPTPMTDITLNDCNIKSVLTYAGGFAGRLDAYAELARCSAENMEVQGFNCIGTLVGYNYANSTECNVTQCNVTGTSIDVGGMFGYQSYTASTNGYVRNCKVQDTNVTGVSDVGGVCGQTDRKIEGCYVYRCTVKATKEKAGGAVGVGGAGSATVVRDCTIVAQKKQAGGLVGLADVSCGTVYISYAAGNDYVGWVDNCRIYSSSEVGGVFGELANTAYGVIATNCEIRGSVNVGGVAGIQKRALFDAYVNKCLVTTINDEIALEYNISSSEETESFGGICGSRVGLGSYYVRDAFVEESIIGDKSADKVGGAFGTCVPNNNTCCLIVKNSVVIGDKEVGGLIGRAENSTYSLTANLNRAMYGGASNAKLVGKSNVGGVAGSVYAVENQGTVTTDNPLYGPLPYVGETYFSGTLTADENAGGYFGAVKGTDLQSSALNILIAPKYIEAGKAEPILGEPSGLTGAYTWSNMTESKTKMCIAMFDATLQNGKRMSEVLSNGKYKPYVDTKADIFTKTNAYYNRTNEIAGDPFVYRCKDSDYLRDNAYAIVGSSRFVNGKKFKINGQPVNFMPLVRYSSVIFNPASPATRTYTNPFTGEVRSVSMAQGVHIPGTQEYEDEIDLMESMYQEYKNGSWNPVQVSRSSGLLMMSRSAHVEAFATLYPSGADSFNIEFSPDFYSLAEAEGTFSIKAFSEQYPEGTMVVENAPVDARTVTVNYNYKDALQISIQYPDEVGNFVTNEITCDEGSLSYMASLWNGEGYYICEDGIHRASDEKLVKSGDFLHIFEGAAIDAEGRVCKLPNLNPGTEVTTALSETVKPLYEFDYEGNRLYTYGTYTLVESESDAKKISDTMRMYVKNGNFISLKKTAGFMPDGLFAYYDGGDSYILALSEDGTVVSLGNVELVERLDGFSNGDIKALTSNMNSSGTTVIFTYFDGSIAGYDVKSGKELFSTEGASGTSFMDYVTDYIGELFNPNVLRLSGARRETDSLISIMENSNLSLDEILQVNSQRDKASDQISVEGFLDEIEDSTMADTTDSAIENDEDMSDTTDAVVVSEGSLNTIEGTGGGIELSEETSYGALSVTSDSSEPSGSSKSSRENSDFTETDSIALNGFKSAGAKNQYVAVYDKAENGFEIYLVNSLLNEPEKAVAETSKVVDKSSLKAMYQALAEGEDDAGHRGITLYVAVVLMILAAFVGIVMARKGRKNQSDK